MKVQASTVPGPPLEPRPPFFAREFKSANAALPCATAIADHTRVNQLLRGLGIVLLLGGLGHTAGVLHLYLTAGVPEANRVLLDVWIAEAQLLGGGLYLAASRASHAGKPSRVLAVFGALVMMGFTLPMLPVLFARAPLVFRIPVVIYLLLSIWILAHAARRRQQPITYHH